MFLLNRFSKNLNKFIIIIIVIIINLFRVDI